MAIEVERAEDYNLLSETKKDFKLKSFSFAQYQK
jgi:hypothetical protein